MTALKPNPIPAGGELIERLREYSRAFDTREQDWPFLSHTLTKAADALQALIGENGELRAALSNVWALSKTMTNAHKLAGPPRYYDKPREAKAYTEATYSYGKELRKIVQTAHLLAGHCTATDTGAHGKPISRAATERVRGDISVLNIRGEDALCEWDGEVWVMMTPRSTLARIKALREASDDPLPNVPVDGRLRGLENGDHPNDT